MLFASVIGTHLVRDIASPMVRKVNLIGAGRPCPDLFGFRQALRAVVRSGLRVADSLGQHLAELNLRLRRFTPARFLPVCHASYMGMREANTTICVVFRIALPKRAWASSRESTDLTKSTNARSRMSSKDLVFANTT